MIDLYTDGASRGNPGPAAAGAWAQKDGEILFELSENLGAQTNNYAEYMAIILSLEKLLNMSLNREVIHVYADSKLAVEQISGSWKVKNENIKPLYARVKEIIKHFDNISFNHIERSCNQKADALANHALDR